MLSVGKQVCWTSNNGLFNLFFITTMAGWILGLKFAHVKVALQPESEISFIYISMFSYKKTKWDVPASWDVKTPRRKIRKPRPVWAVIMGCYHVTFIRTASKNVTGDFSLVESIDSFFLIMTLERVKDCGASWLAMGQWHTSHVCYIITYQNGWLEMTGITF